MGVDSSSSRIWEARLSEFEPFLVGFKGKPKGIHRFGGSLKKHDHICPKPEPRHPRVHGQLVLPHGQLRWSIEKAMLPCLKATAPDLQTPAKLPVNYSGSCLNHGV